MATQHGDEDLKVLRETMKLAYSHDEKPFSDMYCLVDGEEMVYPLEEQWRDYYARKRGEKMLPTLNVAVANYWRRRPSYVGGS